MTTVFVVRMWLVCRPANSAALAAFDKRWTKALERSWKTLVYEKTVSRTSPHDDLNTKIRDDCKADIINDTGFADITSVSAFSSADWQAGSGGLHETIAKPIVAFYNTSQKPWEFDYGGSTKSQMYALAEFAEVTVTP